MNRRATNRTLADQRERRREEIAAAIAAALMRVMARRRFIVQGRLTTIRKTMMGDAPLVPGGRPATNTAVTAPTIVPSEVFLDGFDDEVREEVGGVLERQGISILRALGAGIVVADFLAPRLEAHKDRLGYIGEEAAARVGARMNDAQGRGLGFDEMTDDVLDVFLHMEDIAAKVGETEARTLIDEVGFATVESDPGLGWQKQWVTMEDDRVRDAHADAEELGPIALDEPFDVGGYPMMFPKEPGAPLDLVLGCRCWLEYAPPEDDPDAEPPPMVQELIDAMEASGARFYSEDQPRDANGRFAGGGSDGYAAPERLVEAAKWWAGNLSATDRIQEQADALVTGKPTDVPNEFDQRFAAEMIRSIEAAPKDAPALFRGILVPYDGTGKSGSYTVGQSVEFSLGSFTESRGWAEKFAAGDFARSSYGTPITFHLEPGAQAIDMEPLVDQSRFVVNEKEWVTGGKFEVTSVEPLALKSDSLGYIQHGFSVGIRQTEVHHLDP